MTTRRRRLLCTRDHKTGHSVRPHIEWSGKFPCRTAGTEPFWGCGAGPGMALLGQQFMTRASRTTPLAIIMFSSLPNETFFAPPPPTFRTRVPFGGGGRLALTSRLWIIYRQRCVCFSFTKSRRFRFCQEQVSQLRHDRVQIKTRRALNFVPQKPIAAAKS